VRKDKEGDELIRAVLFDLGGTLLHGRGLGAGLDLAYKGARAAYDTLKAQKVSLPSYPMYLARVTAAFASMGSAGGGLKEMDIRREIGQFFAGIGAQLRDGQLDEALAAWHSPFAAEMHLDPKAVSVLEDLGAQGLRMGVITNSVWPGVLVERHLERLGVKRFFEVVVSSADVGLRKPSPEVFAAAVKRMGVQPSECAYVGDRPREDVVGAQQAGMRSVLLLGPGAKDPGPQPDLTIDALGALPAALRSLA
jgi:putative hydrolase of the HAD superfamily